MKLSSIHSIHSAGFAALFAISVSMSTQAQKSIEKPLEIPTDTQKKKAPAEIQLSPEEIRSEISYGLGFQNGEQFAAHGFMISDLDQAAYIKGLLEALNKNDYTSDTAKFNAAMRAFDKLINEREAKIAKINAATEKAFFEKNGKLEGVVTTDSGLQYKVLKKGTGKTYKQPAGIINGMDSLTEFHVFTRTTLLDGTLLNENKTGRPERYSLQVIQGLAEALKLMPVGSKWTLYVPSKLAFGERRFGSKVSPNSVIVYDIELKDITVRSAPPQTMPR